MITDYPEWIDTCLAAMREKSIQTAAISAESTAEGFLFWEDSSTTNISPDYFVKYAAPEIKEWAKIIKSAEKILVHHACGHIKNLLPLMAETGIDCIESISPPPTGDIEVWDAFDVLPDHISLIGGIEPTVLLNATNEELQKYVLHLLEKITEANNGRRFILANSDSCPPGVSIEKFKLITQLAHNIN